MNVAETLTQILVDEGVEVASGITGQSIGLIADALINNPGINMCYTRQERVAVDVCDGYARVTGKPGVLFTDQGPGVANTAAGILNSYGDSSPLLFLAAANRRFDTPHRGYKELALEEVFGPITNWTTTLLDISQIGDVMRRAFTTLRSGRPGPVIIGVPYDLAPQEVPGDFTYHPAPLRIRSAGDPQEVERAIQILANAQCPYVCAGAGVLMSEGSDELVELAELLTLPVATTLNGKSAFPEDHPLALGKGGITRANYGTIQATRLALEADVILTVGCSFQRHTLMTPIPDDVKVIQVDINPFEMSKQTPVDVPILGDAKLVLRQMVDAARASVPNERLQPKPAVVRRIEELRQEWMDFSMPILTSSETPVNPFRVTWELSQLVNPDETVVLHDAGSVRGSICQHYTATVPHSFIGYGVQSSMGWSLGAALGAKMAAPDKLVVAVTGDEAFGETAMDLETATANDIPILVVLKNNRGHETDPERSAVRAVKIRPVGDYTAMARALGVRATRVEDPETLGETLAESIAWVKNGQSALVEVNTKRVQTSLYPYGA
ncbi:MAG: thiamine pyrophosphate-binding protein [Dehalococcoidia bacterium]